MAKASGTTTIREDESVICRACGKHIVSEFAVEITDTTTIDDPKSVTFGGKVVGMRISHDCIPKATR